MNNRIQQKFVALKVKKQKAFVAFITAGDPDLATTKDAVLTLEKAGCDIIELGMPFSDPMADGPVIQKSSERALKSGTHLKAIFETVAAIRQESQIPILLMGYFNPVYQYGLKAFFRDAKKAGVDGALIVDLPPEEAEDTRLAAQAQDISLIFLLAPTSNESRIALVDQKGSGFIYYVSMTGITGASLQKQLGSQQALKKLKQKTSLPVCVGFGIKNKEQAAEVAPLADGIVVGSALVDLFEKFQGSELQTKLYELTRDLAEATH